MLKTATRIATHPASRVCAGALLAATLALFFFAPRFTLWRGLEIPSWHSYPELNRAVDALKQLEHPFAPIENPSNRVLQWRLLFPVVAHAVGLPGWAYLALPPIGCLLVLGGVVRLLERHGTGWRSAAAAALLTATCSWFLAATGWLAYFDSWCVLGLLVVTFSPSRAIAFAAVLVTPWVDDRFVFTLPLCLFARDRYAATFLQQELAARRRDLVWLAAALLPWVLVRAGAYVMRGDQMTGAYARSMIADNRATNAMSYAAGLWHGLRWAWALPVVVLVAEWRDRRARAALMFAVALATVATLFVVAADVSRSASVMVPFVVLGVLLLQRHQPARVRSVLLAMVALNLLFPAQHVFGNNRARIFYLYSELEDLRRPPPELDARSYNARAQAIVNNTGLPQALELLNAAIRLDPQYAQAYSNRALVLFEMGHLPEAMADANRALELNPDYLTARYNRGKLRAAAGDLTGAIADLERALHGASATWPSRADAEASLRDARARLGTR